MEKEIFTIKDLEGNTVVTFVDWAYTPDEVSDIYGDVIVLDSKGEQILTW